MVNKFIYDAEQHIDIEYIESILLNNDGKEIICFGGGTAAEILMRKLLHKYKIACFLDNNKKLQGGSLFNIDIYSPEILKEKQKGSFIVLILSKHVNAISQQLRELGLDETDYYDIYNQFISYFRIKKYEKNAYDFIEFIERIPDGYFDQIPLKNENENRIGIVCFGEMIKNLTWYQMAQSLVLRHYGYKSTLIIDTLRSFDSYIYFDGIESIARIYIEYVLKILQMKCKDIEVVYIDETMNADLEQDDIHMTEKYAPLVVKWLNSRRDEVFLPKESNRIQIAQSILEETMRHIKAFFHKNEFDTINVYTGIHRHRCVYTYLGQRLGWRVSTYDGDENGLVLYDTDGVSGHALDIKRLIKGKEFNEEQRRRIVELGKADFAIRQNKIAGEGYNFQIVEYSQNIVPYDIIMPLNIAWDSAALAKDDLFADEIEWINCTLEYLMNNTSATVMIREHPAKNMFKEFRFPNYEEELPILHKFKDRIYFADATAKINSYQYIEKCKVVLPYSSTVGVESVMMGKNVIVHTNVYYDDIGIAYKGKSKEDYFERIKMCLEDTNLSNVGNMDNAFMAYYLQMQHGFMTTFGECFVDWMKKDIKELSNMDSQDKVVGIIAKNETAIYKNVLAKL